MDSISILKTLCYCSESGNLYYIRDMKSGKRKGEKAGYVESTGYIRVRINSKNYQAHRVAWFLYYGNEPNGVIDHIDGDKLNNKITNLRDCSASENLQNQKKAQKGSKSGILGVSQQGSKWCARIDINKVLYRIGAYKTIEEAEIAYLKAKRKLHEFCTI